MADEQRHQLPPRMTERARGLRREATFPERLLWSRLRNRQVGGAKLRRQHVIGQYVVDSSAQSASSSSSWTGTAPTRRRPPIWSGRGIFSSKSFV